MGTFKGSNVNRRDFLKALALVSLCSLKTVQAAGTADPPPGAASQPNILIIVLDTLSALHMPLYGYPRETTPQIDRFAQRATIFHNHYAGGSFTTPGTASLLTGALPWSHRAIHHLRDTVIDKFVPRNLFTIAPHGIYKKGYTHNNLALALLYQVRSYLDELVMPRELAIQDLNYSDLLFPKDYNIAHIGEEISLRADPIEAGSLFLSFIYRWIKQARVKQLDAQYKKEFPRGVPEHDEMFFFMGDAIDWTIEQTRSMPQPYLAYFHYLPPHNPYSPRREFLGLFDDQYSPPKKPESFASDGFSQKYLNNRRLAYDRYLAYTDSEMGRLFAAMEKAGALENTYLILTSDHGELFERGISGHTTPVLYESLVRVPLIISKPGAQSRQDVYERTTCVDLLPTTASIYGQSIPEWCEGQILPTFTSLASAERPIFVSDSKSNPKYGPMTSGSYMLIQGDFKWVHYMGEAEKDELYNLVEDPEEMVNLISTRSSVAAELQALLNQKLKQVNQSV